MSGLFVSRLPFPFQVWPDLEWNQDSVDPPEEFLRLLTSSCFLLLLLGSFLRLPSLTSVESAFLHCGSALSSLCSRSDPPRYHKGVALAHLDSLPPHNLVLWIDGSVSFSKGGSGLLANCSLCGTEVTPSFSTDPVCSSFFAKACAILHALCWSRQHQKVCQFSCPPF